MDDGRVLRSMVRDDSYTVVRVLAEGASGKTELVTLGGNELLVRKRIPAELANASAWATLMGLHEPRLPHIEELYEMPDELVVVYTYVPGASLRELVNEQGPLPPDRATKLVMEVCEAASALHQAGLVHRDITPGNVIVADDGAHLVDFGIARRQRLDSQHDTSVLGTWGFAAPEQFGFAQTDQRSDVFSLGRLLGYALTGEAPGTEAYEQAMVDPARVPARLAEVCARASTFEPSARFQSARELSLELMSVVLETTGEPAVPHGHGQLSEMPERPSQDSPSQDRRSAQVPQGRRAVLAPRRYSDAPLLARIGVILVWLAALLWIALVAAVCIDDLIRGVDGWGAAQHGMSAISSAGAIAIGYEAYRALALRDGYGSEARPIWLLAKKVCKILGITLLLMLLCPFLPDMS